MIGFRSNIKKEKYFFEWQQNKVKLTVFHESRKDSRVSLSKSGVNIRLPILLPEFEKQKLISKFIAWAKERLDEKPHFHYDKFKKYENGDQIVFFDKTFTLNITRNNLNLSSIKQKDGYFQIALPESLDGEIFHKTISKLVYKKAAQMYKPILWAWLLSLNEKHAFGCLNSIRMKNNSTNWGSCSNKGNVNISIRLLLAPKDVVEYVLIHELAHLQQQNHGRKFWELVSKACPAYKKHELWLKTNAKSCVV